MKVAVIGSSHTVALKTGWDLVQDTFSDRIEPTFFGVGANFVPNFGLDDEQVWRPLPSLGNANVLKLARQQSQYINGAEELDLKPFDAICLVGFEAGLEMIFRVIPQVHIGLEAEQRHKNCQKTLISDETFAGLQTDVLANAIKRWPLAGLKNARVFLQPPPLLFEKFTDKKIGGPVGQKVQAEIDRNPQFPSLVRRYRDRMTAEFKVAYNVIVLPQDTNTIAANGVLSADSFGQGAMRLNGEPQSGADFGHGNSEYGALCWRSLGRQVLPA